MLAHVTTLAGRLLAASEEGGGGGDHGTGLPILPHTSELIFGIIAISIILFVAWKKVVPAMETMYAERTAAIEGGMKQAEEAQAAAEAAKEQYEAQLAQARAEAAQIRENARAEGAQILAESRENANAEAARITESANRQIEAERQAAATSLRGEVGRLSTDLASKIVGESLHDEVRSKGIVDRFLADLESGAIRPEKVGN